MSTVSTSRRLVNSIEFASTQCVTLPCESGYLRLLRTTGSPGEDAGLLLLCRPALRTRPGADSLGSRPAALRPGLAPLDADCHGRAQLRKQRRSAGDQPRRHRRVAGQSSVYCASGDRARAPTASAARQGRAARVPAARRTQCRCWLAVRTHTGPSARVGRPAVPPPVGERGVLPRRSMNATLGRALVDWSD